MKTLLLFILCSSLACAYDFDMSLSGPATATPGYPIYLQINVTVTEGVKDGWTSYDVVSPFGATLVGRNSNPSWGMKTYSPENVILKLDVPSDAVPGLHTVSVTARSEGGVTRNDEMNLEVVVPIAPLPITVEEGKPAALKIWERNMIFSGEERCDGEAIVKAGTWEGNAWFYDGIRVFYQIADYSGNPRWSECAGYVKSVYLPYVLENEGKIQGFRVFSEGLYQDYLRTGNEESKRGVLLMASNSAFANAGGGLSPVRSRETAYILDAYRFARLLGAPHPNEAQALAFALGHIDQWFNLRARYSGDAYYVQPFMVGLTMETLIHYYEESPDPRIPSAVKKALDGMWELWDRKDGGFDYITNDDEVKGAPDLNLLIAPAFAWMYLQTGDPIYRERGEEIFTDGVRRAWLGQGKHFTQNYRWSFDYVRWATITEGEKHQRNTSLRPGEPRSERVAPRARP